MSAGDQEVFILANIGEIDVYTLVLMQCSCWETHKNLSADSKSDAVNKHFNAKVKQLWNTKGILKNDSRKLLSDL